MVLFHGSKEHNTREGSNMAKIEGDQKVLSAVPESLRGKVAFSLAVCSDCANCPVVHHAVDGGVIVTNDADPDAPAVLFTHDQWAEFTDNLRTGLIE